MKKFIAHGAVATVISAVALVPLAGVAQADTPLRMGPRAVTSAKQHALGDTSRTSTTARSDRAEGRDESHLRASYWEGFHDGYALGARRHIRDDDDRGYRPDSYWDGFRDGYRLGERHRCHRRHDEDGDGYDHRSDFHNGYYDARRHCHHRHHHHHHHRRHHHKRCLWKELLGI
ncbi:hypothetical protein NGB36_31505 [Streptomyces sp. RB6PN25]|uniref:Uncharacterized protein n=1 Tax=Streptomyces humicola TaxID=2953240 RepID=A0ABT1Q6H3_9ACTN|nr:hypothetical protein [Streptomyces humicola]MCQ4084970.1 hypothetical protein [Streptomyces humicola]